MNYIIKQTFFSFICVLDSILCRQGVPVLFFHSVDESGSPLSISSEKFLKFIEYLHQRGCKNALITFDDGYKNNIEAIKVLQQFSFRTIVFVATAYIGKKNTFCRTDFPELEMMNANDIGQLAKQGVEFGAHGHTHRNLPELSQSDLIFEIKESRRILEEIAADKINYFCYPRGKYSKSIAAELERQGFRRAFTARTGIVSKESHPYFLPRVPLNDAVSFLQFRALLSPWYATFRNLIK